MWTGTEFSTYYLSEQGFRLLDLTNLIAGNLKQLLAASGLKDAVKLGLVQTAYANGSSTKYIINSLGVPMACDWTGLKHLHSLEGVSQTLGDAISDSLVIGRVLADR